MSNLQEDTGLRKKIAQITREPNLLSTNTPSGGVDTEAHYPMTDEIMQLIRSRDEQRDKELLTELTMKDSREG